MPSTLFQWHVFQVQQQKHTLPDDRIVDWTHLHHPGAVVILPLMPDGKILLLKQYRPAIGKWIYEVPAGTLEPDEDILQCAQRELIEETNHHATDWTDLGTLLPAPGFCDEVQHCYLARALEQHAGQKDDDEFFEQVPVTEKHFVELIAQGKIIDSKTIAIWAKWKANKNLLLAEMTS
ncbi:NUDIX hydrolase [Pelagibaculum spongiae]|uniref:GDP-mannose pyrophosphatase n=1 Tax=Pelagibaculum spongiae TaxID=2080658 RepID=A0A2V1GV57_9GAMM|nr:NUDIX hydrolase [Pelagibaculum spongiae]PVZ70285.1 ADP-ribose pyrophosphatase [Pelagibaculum spongiae]